MSAASIPRGAGEAFRAEATTQGLSVLDLSLRSDAREPLDRPPRLDLVLTGEAHRAFVRSNSACPVCGVEVGAMCVSLETGARRMANHAERVEAVTGQDLTSVNWRAASQRARVRSGNHAGRPALRKRAPGGW